MASIESGGSPDTIGVNTEPFIPAMTEELNSTDNSITHDPDGQRALPAPPEADHTTQYTTANGSNPSGVAGSNPSQSFEDTMDDLRNRINAAQSTNDFFRTENLALKKQLLQMARENQESRQEQLNLISALQDEIQELKTRVTEVPKGKESFPEKKNHMPILSQNLLRTFPNLTRIEVKLNFVHGKITGKKLKLLSESQIATT